MNKNNQVKNNLEVCRLCLSPKNLLAMFCGKARDRRNSLRKMIDEVMQIGIERDHINSFVCINCCVDVSNIYRFKWSCLQNQDKFQSELEYRQSPGNPRKKVKLESPQLKDIKCPTIESSEEIMAWLQKKRLNIVGDLPLPKDVEVQVELSNGQPDLVDTESQTDAIIEKSLPSREVQTEGSYPQKKRNFKTQTNKIKVYDVPSKCDMAVQTEEIACKGSKVSNSNTQTEGVYVLRTDPPKTKNSKIQTDQRRTHHKHIQITAEKIKKQFKNVEIQTYLELINKTNVSTATENTNLNDSSSQTKLLIHTDNVTQTAPQLNNKNSSNSFKNKTSKSNRLSLKSHSTGDLESSINVTTQTEMIKSNLEAHINIATQTEVTKLESKILQTESVCCLEQFTQTDVKLNASEINRLEVDAVTAEKYNLPYLLSVAIPPEERPFDLNGTSPSRRSLNNSESITSLNSTSCISVPLCTPEKLCEPKKKRGRPKRVSAVGHTKCDFYNDDLRIKPELSTTCLTRSKMNDLPSTGVNNNKDIKNEDIKTEPPSSALAAEVVVSPRSSGLVNVEASKVVNICKYCDKLLFNKMQASAHERSHKQCKFCRKKFPSIPITMEHGNVCKIKNMTSRLLYVDLIRLDDDLNILKRYPSIAEQLWCNHSYSLECLKKESETSL